MRKIYYSKPFIVDPFITPGSFDETLYSIKRDLILFDQVVFPNLQTKLNNIYNHYKNYYGNEYEIKMAEFYHLQTENLIRDYDLENKSYLTKEILSSLDEFDSFILDACSTLANDFSGKISTLYCNYSNESDIIKKVDILNSIIQMSNIHDSISSLVLTEHLNYYEKIETINSRPMNLLNDNFNVAETISIRKPKVYSVIINDLDLPSDLTPWRDIIDYKDEFDNKGRLARLRVWLNKVIKEEYSENELTDEYDSFYQDFSAAIKRHKMKTKKTALKILLVGGAGMVEDVIKLRFKSIMEKIYNQTLEVNNELIELAESEANAPGKELAYIFFSKERFKNS